MLGRPHHAGCREEVRREHATAAWRRGRYPVGLNSGAIKSKHNEAVRLLKDVYDWFTEGYETADLRDARATLDEMSAPP